MKLQTLKCTEILTRKWLVLNFNLIDYNYFDYI